MLIHHTKIIGSFSKSEIKKGSILARLRWNINNGCNFPKVIYYVGPKEHETVTESDKSMFGDTVRYNGYIAQTDSKGVVSVWQPTTEDMMGDDWAIIEVSRKKVLPVDNTESVQSSVHEARRSKSLQYLIHEAKCKLELVDSHIITVPAKVTKVDGIIVTTESPEETLKEISKWFGTVELMLIYRGYHSFRVTK